MQEEQQERGLHLMRENLSRCQTFRGRSGIIQIWERTYISDVPGKLHITFQNVEDMNMDIKSLLQARFLSQNWNFQEEFIGEYMPSLNHHNDKVPLCFFGQSWRIFDQ